MGIMAMGLVKERRGIRCPIKDGRHGHTVRSDI